MPLLSELSDFIGPRSPLADARARFKDELSNPAVRNQVMALTNREVGGQGLEAQQAFLESLFNRATARGTPIAGQMTLAGQGGYYPALGNPNSVGPEAKQRYEELLSQVGSGSNVSNYATGNASGTVGFNGGPQTAAYGGERFGVEGPDRAAMKSIAGGDLPDMPRNATLTSGKTGMDQPGFLSQLASLGGGNGSPGFGDRLNAGLQGFANGGKLLPAVSNLLSGLATGQRADPRGIEIQREQALQRYAQNAPDTDSALRELAATNPAVAELIVKQQLAQPTLQKGDADLFGNTPFYTYKNGKLTQLTPSGGAPGPTSSGGGNGILEGMSLLAPGVQKVDSSLAGDDYLKQFSPEVQSAVKSYINGDVIPSGNPRQKGIANIAKTIAQKYGQDTGTEVNDRTYAAKRQFQVDLSRTNPASAGGQRVAMQTGIEHLESLAKRIEDLGNKDVLGIAPLGRLVNSARGLQTEQAGKVNAVQQASQLFSAEIMKMYSGSQGGGVHERDDMRARFDAAKTPQELGQAIDTGLDLIAGRRHALENMRDSLGSKAEILNKADDERIARIREIASKLKAGGGVAPKAPAAPDSGGWTDVGNGVRIRQK